MLQPSSSPRTQPSKILVCDVTDVRLVAQRSSGQARFVVLHPPDYMECRPQRLLASGTEADLAAAMTSAERVLEDLGLPRTEWLVL